MVAASGRWRPFRWRALLAYLPAHLPAFLLECLLACLIACLIACLSALAAGPAAAQAQVHDHDEFEAWLETPGHGGDTFAERRFVLTFHHPTARPGQVVDWRLELTAPDGSVVERWRGIGELIRGTGRQVVSWRPRGPRPARGVYRLRMTAMPHGDSAAAVEEQRPVTVGAAALPLPPRAAVDRAPPGTAGVAGGVRMPGWADWDIYLGNLHSQTNHSDGGGDVASCTGAQHPQSAAAGPAEAYAYAADHGLQFLLTSEHNHMYDGAEDTDPAADPARAKALYRSGLDQAAAFNAAHPGFVALYGLEWGVITHGGHLNILNTPELLEWERNGAGELIGDTFTEKNNYRALYTLMRERGWLGQFNHPSDNQFRVAGRSLGYTEDGDAVMALCEVANSAAFSARTDEGETRISVYERMCDRALEAGFHVAFSSDQDNHCANWGTAAPNRTGVLLPKDQPFTAAALLGAIRARRVFATMDKGSQLMLTANGQMMGERLANRGTLTLSVLYRNDAGRAATELVIVEGVPGRNGTPVTMVLTGGDVTVAPSPGEHYYYARLTQDDGKMLWSAPVWVTQHP
ncbi:CehA/McbA family metallohydrolase [Pseudoduganella flava]|nr:CehA/McbA family metallohydrolase [Pseudoduganella flava]